MHGGCVHAGAKADHQHGGAGFGGASDNRAQVAGVNRPQRMALGLQVVQNRRVIGSGRGGQAKSGDGPIKVGHSRHAVMNGASGGHTST